MAESFQTDDPIVAATFAALELTLKTVSVSRALENPDRADEVSKTFAVYYKAIREAQISDT